MVNLFDSFSKSQGEAKANYLALTGLNLVFRDTNPASKELIAELFKTNVIADVLFGNKTLYHASYHGDLLSNSFSWAKSNGVDLLTKPGFSEWISSNANRLMDDITACRYKANWESPSTDYIAFIEAGFLSGKADPTAIFHKRFLDYTNRSRINGFEVYLMKAVAARVPKLFIDQIEGIDFASNVGYGLRAKIFEAIGETGHLTKKAARKIRSDASEEAASSGIRAIADNIDKFPNANEVLAQIMDTKYLGPARYLVQTIPRDLLPFMVVCQNQDIRKLIVERMQNPES